MIDKANQKISDAINAETGEIVGEKLVWHKIELSNIVMKDNQWSIEVIFGEAIPKLLMYYQILWTADFDPIDREIEKNRQNRIDYQASLLDDVDQLEYKDFDKRENSLLESRAELSRVCPDNEFPVGILSLKNRPTVTVINFSVPHSQISFLNDHILDIPQYKIALKKI